MVFIPNDKAVPYPNCSATVTNYYTEELTTPEEIQTIYCVQCYECLNTITSTESFKSAQASWNETYLKKLDEMVDDANKLGILKTDGKGRIVVEPYNIYMENI